MDALQIGGDQTDAECGRGSAGTRVAADRARRSAARSSIREVADVRGQPEQAVADADLVRKRDDLAVALEEVMVEVLDCRARHREGVGLPAEPLSALPERDPMPWLGKPKGGGQPGDTATDDGDARALSRR